MSPTIALLLRVVHLLAVILWAGGLVSVGLSAAFGAQQPGGIATARRLQRRLVNPAMIVAWLAALAMLFDGWQSLYARAGWMHGKITLALLLSGLTGFVGARLRRAEAAESAPSGSTYSRAAIATMAIATLIVVLAKFKFGG